MTITPEPTVRYDRIGRGYAGTRQPDPRIQRRIDAALGAARTVVNVGAGAGSYEPAWCTVTPVEPSQVMLAQRPDGGAGAVRAVAEALPFTDRSFDAAMTVLSVHHWTDLAAGLRELRRVARQRVVVFTHDPGFGDIFWLTARYFPAIAEADRLRFPVVERLTDVLGLAEVEAIPVPFDCRDGFLGAFWREPRVYLQHHIRAGMSGFAMLDAASHQAGVELLRRDLANGEWERRYGHLRAETALDLGYRLVTFTL